MNLQEWIDNGKPINSIVNCDCLLGMKEIEDNSIDCIITDPPYGINGNYDLYEDTEENLIKLIKIFMPEFKRISKRICIFTGVKNITLFPRSDWILSWVNKAGCGCGRWGFTCWTPIIVYGKDPYLESRRGSRPDTLIQAGLQGIRKGYKHPFEKPLSVMKWVIERTSNEHDLILDPFLGSGTTARACKDLGRKCIGIEISQKYCDIAVKRLGQEVLF